MSGIHVELVRSTVHQSRVRVTGSVGEHELYIATEGELVRDDMSGWLPALLPVAMSAGEPLVLHGPVDVEAVRGANAAQLLLNRWYGDRLQQVDVLADEVEIGGTGGRGSVALFSGGVDSFHTAFRNNTSHLMFIQGFDIPLDARERLSDTRRHLVRAATAMGRQLVVVKTNIRHLADRRVSWGYEYHGALIAGISLAHSPMWERVYIPSSYPPEDLHPWGSHPELDPLWSSSSVTITHDSLEWPRARKVREIAKWPVAMEHLRVCWNITGSAYNCGRCEKCLRTMVELHLAEAQCSSLPNDLSPSRVLQVPIKTSSARRFARSNMRAARKHGDNILAGALALAIARGVVEGSRPFRVVRGYSREALRRLTLHPSYRK